MGNKDRYWEARNAGLCVCCGKPADKSRCPKCMKDITAHTRKWRQGRVSALKERIRVLEQELKERPVSVEPEPEMEPEAECTGGGKGCCGCKYWRTAWEGMSHCNFFFLTGKTRLGLHKKEYLSLKTEAEREAFLHDMTINCRERKAGKRKRVKSVWSLTDKRAKKKNGKTEENQVLMEGQA